MEAEGRGGERGREGGKHGQRKGKWIDFVELYKIRNSTESLKLGGGHINPKIHFLEEKKFQFQHFLHILALFLHTH